MSAPYVPVPRFRRGMTVHERRKLREALFAREQQRAVERAAVIHVSGTCVRAMVITHERPEEARALHASCRGEAYGGAGCLCMCHDVITGEVLTGSVELPGRAVLTVVRLTGSCTSPRS